MDITDASRLEPSRAAPAGDALLRLALEALPAGAYLCDADGLITWFNRQAAELWGREPRLGDPRDRFCGSFRLFAADGAPIAHAQCWMALALQQDRAFVGEEIVVERPDGSRREVLAHASPIRDASGRLLGAINLLVDVSARAAAALELSARTQAERATAHLAAVVESSSDAILTKDLDGVITSWNQGATRLFGYAPEEAIGRSITMLMPPERVHEEQGILERLRRGERIEHFETVRVRKDGSAVDISLTLSPIRNAAGAITGISKIARDVGALRRVSQERTELLARERAARAEAETLNLLARDVAAELDQHKLLQRITDVATEQVGAQFGAFFYNVTDERGESYLLYTLSGVLREAFASFPMPRNTALFGPTFAGQSVVRIDDVLADPRYGRNPPYHGMPEGHLPVRSYLAASVVLRSGEVLGGLFFGHPEPGVFTERDERVLVGLAAHAAVALDNARLYAKAREDAASVAASEQRYRTLVSVITDVPWTTDAEGRFAAPQPAWTSYTGQDFEAHRDFGWVEALHPEDRQDIVAAWQAAVAARTTYKARARLWHAPSGAWRHIEARATPMFDDEGGVVEWVGSCTDVHQRRQAEQALRDADRRKDEFLATLAHELRNPLASMRNVVQVLRLKGPSDAELDWGRDVIDRQLQQLTRLVDDLLDVSRINEGKLDLRLERTPLSAVVAACLETARPLIDAGGHTLSVSQPAEPLFVHGDLTRLAQVAGNLLNNAAKYTERGGRIALVVERHGEGGCLRVRDNGIGIAAPMLARVFDMFTQTEHPLTREHGGLGIGLTLARRLVEMHGGTIEAKSDGPGRGSEFSVCLPLMPAVEPVARAPGSNAAAASGAASRRILVVDDNRDAADSLGMLLMLQGHEVTIAHDGLEAIEKARAAPPEVIFLDIGMPRLNGYETARRIRAEPWGERITLVALTGWGQEEDRQRTAEAGFAHHLTKPVDSQGLERVLAAQPAR